MSKIDKTTMRLPVICVREDTWSSASIFNPNSWSGESKGIIQSCWAEFSVLNYCSRQIVRICSKAESLCQSDINAIQKHWIEKRFDIKKVNIYSEQPEIHLRIEAFLSGIKSFLDLFVQLLSSENIVNCRIHGFHSQNKVPGGNVLNALKNNALSNKKNIVNDISTLINEHKTKWIDHAIQARNDLVHPIKGANQLMFRIEFAEKKNEIMKTAIVPPAIDFKPVDQYTAGVLVYITTFSSEFMRKLRQE